MPRDYRGAGEARVGDVIELFIERVDDYRATVHRCAPERAATAVASILRETGRRGIVVPPGFPDDLLGDSEGVHGPRNLEVLVVG